MPSAVIQHFSYNAESGYLTIFFVSGMVYRYKKVPQKMYDKFKVAPSKGRYFNRYIKDKYTFEKVEEI